MTNFLPEIHELLVHLLLVCAIVNYDLSEPTMTCWNQFFRSDSSKPPHIVPNSTIHVRVCRHIAQATPLRLLRCEASFRWRGCVQPVLRASNGATAVREVRKASHFTIHFSRTGTVRSDFNKPTSKAREICASHIRLGRVDRQQPSQAAGPSEGRSNDDEVVYAVAVGPRWRENNTDRTDCIC